MSTSFRNKMGVRGIYIVGAGGCGREVANWIEDINAEKETWQILGFLDDNESALDGIASRYEVVGTISGHTPDENAYYAMGMANPATKRKIAEKLVAAGARFASIIHPSTRIYCETEPGIGLVTYPNSKIATGCRIGDFVTLQSTILGHDAQVGNYVTVSSSCGITGGVKLKDGCFIGDHAAISLGIEIGEDAYVGIGSVVIRDVEAESRVFGNPARAFPGK